MRWKEGAGVERGVATVRGLLPSEWLSESAISVFVSVCSDALEVAVEEVVNEESAEEEVGVCVGDPAPARAVLEDDDVADDVAIEEEGEEGVGSLVSVSFFTFINSLPLPLPLPVSLFKDIISFNAAGIAFAAFVPFTALAALTGTTTIGAGLVK